MSFEEYDDVYVSSCYIETTRKGYFPKMGHLSIGYGEPTQKEYVPQYYNVSSLFTMKQWHAVIERKSLGESFIIPTDYSALSRSF